jgi:MFS family permease
MVAKLLGFGATQAINVAIAYQIYELTNDPLSLALVGLVLVIPVFFSMPVVGYVADILDRRLILVACNVALGFACVLIFFLTVFAVEALWPYYAVVFLTGIPRAFYGASSNAAVPSLVPQELIPNAISWNVSIIKITQIGGPMIGGFLYLWGPEVVYAVSAAALFLGALTNWLTEPRPPAAKGEKGGFKTLFAGLFYVYQTKMIMGAITIDMIVCLMGGVQGLIPIFAKDILDVGPAGAGVLRSALAFGGLAMALVLTRLSIARHAGIWMVVGVAVFGATTMLFGLSTSYPLSIVALILVGAADMININVRHTIMQIATPDSLRGRVSAVNSFSANASTELGTARAGSFAAVMEAGPAVAVGGAFIILTAALCPRLFPELTKVDRLSDLTPEPQKASA